MRFLRHLCLLLLVLVAHSQITGCPQLCTNNCYLGPCLGCYQDFTSNAPISSSSCSCPSGMFKTFIGLCQPCPVECMTCTNATRCLTCISGYRLSNSYKCIVNITTENNWVSKMAVNNYTNLMGEGPLTIYNASHGLINITQSNFNSFETICLGLDGTTWFGGYQKFDYTAKVVKTVYNLPPHQWINVRFKTVIIDQWTGNTLVVQLNQNLNYQAGVVSSPSTPIWNGTFNANNRFSDFCGDPTYFDNIAVVDAWSAHNSSLAKIQIRMNESDIVYTTAGNPNIFKTYWAMTDAIVRVGSCGRNCQFCSSPSKCTYCHPPYFAVNGICVCDVAHGLGFPTKTGCAPNCVEGEYYNSTAQMCINCFTEYPNCRTCNSTICTSCRLGFFYYSQANGRNLCKNQCPPGFGEVRNSSYTDSDGSVYYRDECKACPANCSTCNHNICLFCDSGFSYFQGNCTQNCPAAHYSKQGVCTPCKTGCLNCTSNTCSLCSDGLSVDNTGSCVPTCQSTSTCTTSCTSPCATCYGSNNNKCLSCIAGHILSGHRCINACEKRQYNNSGLCTNCTYGCDTCSSTTVCTTCIPGFFFVQADSTCVRLCPIGFYPDHVFFAGNNTYQNKCLACQTGCLRCINSTFCLDCQSNYTSFNFSCGSSAPDYYQWTNGSFRRCPSNCIKCRHLICTRCASGWILNQGQCFTSCPAQKFKKTIINYNNGVFGGAYDVCAWKDPLCEVTANDGSGNCSKCSFIYPAAVLLNSTTSPEPQTVCSPYCPQFHTKNLDLTCTLCPDNCRRCLPNLTCLKCLDSHVINHPSLITDVKTTTCVRHFCADGFFSDSLQCQPCSHGCSQCLLDGRCHHCMSGFTMDHHLKKCYDLNCLVTEFYSSGSCASCVLPCATCTGSGTTCTSCNPTTTTTGSVTTTVVYFLHANTCVMACPDGTFAHMQSQTCRKCDPRCSRCSSIRNCTACANNFYLLTFYDAAHTPCVPECPLGFWSNSSTVCQRCAPDCKSCYGPSEYQCLTCYPNFYLDQSKCVYFCSAMKYADKKEGYCQWCHPSCAECWGPTRYQCIHCKPGYFIYNHICYNYSCPGATYLAIPSQRLCEPCQFGCQYCSSSQFCYFCTPGYHFYQGWCYLQCPDNLQPVYQRYYMQLLGTICSGCASEYSSNCVACDQHSCKKCKEGMFLWQESTVMVMSGNADSVFQVVEQCFSQCPQGTFLREEKECVRCSANCASCSRYESCTQCNSTYNLINGYCTQTCPQGYYRSTSTSGCSPCDASCATCSSLSSCTSCPSGKYLKYTPSTQITTCVSACSSGFFADPSGWCIKCPSTCIECLNLTHCTSCYSGYSLTNNRCTNSTNTCTSNCGGCEGGVCFQCHDPYLLLSDSSSGAQTCVTQCPSGYFSTAFECKKCNATCASCNNTANNCTTCVAAMFRFKSQCLSGCPVGFFANQTSRACQPCPSHCLNCNNRTCISCQTGYYLHNSSCVSACPNGTFASPSSRMCLNCTGNCSACPDIQNCSTCAVGYILFNYTCYTQCPQNTYLTSDQHGRQVCKRCQAPCFRCLDEDNCLSCIGGYLLNGTQCQQECGEGYYLQTTEVSFSNQVSGQNFSMYSQCRPCDQHCLTCSNSSDNCLSCEQDAIFFGGKCVEHCPDSTFNVSNVCINCPSACLRCSNQTSCQVCVSGAVFFNGSCTSACPQGYYTRAISNGGDLQYNCTPCNTSCSSCNGDSLYDCLSCTPGFYLFNGMCLLSCPNGYYPRNSTSTCSPCPTTCTLCVSFSNCSACQTGYTLSNTRQCSNGQSNSCTIPYCLTCYPLATTGGSAVCEQCLSGYSLTLDGQCLATCPSGNYSLNGYCRPCGANCTNCTASGCTICASTYSLYNGICYKKCPNGTINSTSSATCQPDPCLYYNSTNSSACMACSSPYLNYNYSCVLNCPVGTVQSGTQCVACPFNCMYCVSPSACTQCKPATYLFQGQCRFHCPVGTYNSSGQCQYCSMPYCLQCSSASNCSACDETAGAALSNFTCYLNCPTGTYRSSLLGQCLNCTIGCSACVNSSFCTACVSPYRYANGQCLLTCPQGSYLSSGSCLPCSSNCYSCLNGTSCALCLPGYNLYTSGATSSCVSACPTGFYAASVPSTLYNNSNTGICLPCSPPCLTCSTSGTTCTQCQSGYSLTGTTCSTTCSAGYYPIIQIGVGLFGYTFQILVCFPCSPHCATCSSWSTCTSCGPNMNLDPYGNCLGPCAPIQYYDSLVRLCLNCSSLCYECSGPLSTDCLSCNPPLQLYQGSCMTVCPFGFYATNTYYCQPCSINCADCEYSANNCTVCQEGAFLQNTTTGMTCAVSCPAGKYLNATLQQCMNCHVNCINCTGSAINQCTACNSSAFLYSGMCVTACPTGTTKVYNFKTQSVDCQSCPSNCLACQFTLTAGLNCSQCAANYYLINGSCLATCPTGTYPSPASTSCIDCGIPGCLTCTFNSSFQVQCTACQSGYLMQTDLQLCVTSCPSGYIQTGPTCVPSPVCSMYLYNGFCLSSCPTAMYPSAATSPKTCLNCSQSCLSCGNSSTCTQCSNTSLLFFNSTNSSSYCLTYCPSGFYASQGTCQPCPSTCQTCFLSQGLLSCGSCPATAYLLNGQCLAACPSGYFAVTQSAGNVCQPCAANCAECAVASTNCTACQNSAYSPSTTPSCSSQTCTSLQYESAPGVCTNCHNTCATCFGGAFYECSSCPSSTFMHQGQCLSTCPSGYFASTSPSTCILCPIYCATCTSSSVCTVCQTGYYLNPATSSCVASCASLSTATMTYYLSGTSCQPCSAYDVNCVVCGVSYNAATNANAMACSQCTPNKYLYMGLCYSACPSGTYAAVTNNVNICMNCSLSCVTCNSTGCMSCFTGKVLSSSQQCLSSCPSGYFMSTIASVSTCQPCSTHCTVCSSSSTCTTCSQPYVLVSSQCTGCIDGYYYSSSNTCLKCSSECATCTTSSTNCLTCAAGWVVHLNQCLANCPAGYYNNNGVCAACATANCASCPNNVCDSCSSTFVRLVVGTTVTCPSACPSAYFLDTTTKTCHACSTNCLTCTSATSCSQCNSTVSALYGGYCLSTCPSGYTSVSGVCTACLTNCLTCSPTTTCTLCSTGMTNNNNGTCSPATNNCSSGYFYNTATSNCSQCYPTCQTCSGPSVSNCLTCFSGATLSNGVCTASCNSGYFFNSTSTNCQLCSSVYTNCVACNSTHCTQCATNYSLSAGVCSLSCPNGTYLASGQCLSCSAFCLICTSATTCTQCINSSLILYSNACHTSCPQLTYFNGSTCVPCSQTCLTCTGSATNCGSCVTPYSLSGTNCVASCPNGTFTSNYVCVNCSTNCLLCSSLTNCTQCASSFYELNGTCRSSCPTGYYTDTASSRCLACLPPCTQCVSRTNCSACQVGYTHNTTADTCMNQCPVGQYYNNSQTTCVACSLTNCGVCNSTHCLACASPNYAFYSNGNIAFCLSSCPAGTYPDNTTMICQPCYNNCALCTNASFCTKCSTNYYLLSVVSTINECVLTCPIGYFAFVDANGFLPSSCQACSSNCNTCINATYCSACASHYYRFTTQNVNTATNVSCVNNCPSGYSNPSVISGTGMCSLCGANCLICLDPATCTECVSTNYVVLNGICTPFNCLNCLNCSEPINTCYQCASGYYLHNSGCTSHCPNGYYGNVTTGKCELCMANCQLCLNSTGCVQCISSYTFYDVTGTCQNQGYIQFGAAGNMSGFTSNITQIMATTYVATSAGPIAFGALTNTYGMMQTCQFMYLMAGSSDGNPEMVTFLDSLSICSYSNSGNTTANTTTTGRLLTAAAYTDSFLTTSFPIFIMMGCFICAYICVVLFGKYNQSCCTNFPCLQKYMRYTCRFMEKRFKYIYVDLVMWISYIPFLYFSMLQIKGNMWSTGLEIFSSLLAYVIIIVYPLYPFFILRKIFDKSDDRRQNLRNYKAITLKLPIDEEQLAKQPLCASFQCCPREDPNTSMIEMSLSPYIDKVVRPVYNIDVPEYSQFKYFTIPHWRLAYAALKYFRKFLFVVFVAAMPTPAATLGSLVGLSVVYLLYLFILRPKQKLYLILEIILEFLILGFEIFMLIYVTTSGATVSALSIVAHAIGFAMANSTLAIAIILNLMAYYTIFCCIVDCIRHLKASADQDEFRQGKEQIDAEDQKDMDFDDGQYEFPDQGIKVDLEKDLIRQFDGDQQPQELVGNLDMEKELVRNFGRNVDEYPDTVIPYDLEKKLVHEFGGDHLARDLVKNQNLEKELVRNFGREKDGDYYPETVIPYDLEKKLVRDFDGERHPEDLIKNNDLEKELVRNFGRNHDDEDAPCIPYDLEKKIVRDFGGDRHPEDLVKNNDLEKDLVRNFGRPHDDYDDEPPCIPYDLEKQLVRDFGGETHPEDLIGNGDLEKELVRNFGRNHDDDLDDEPPCIPYDLEKKIIKDFGGDAHPEDLVKNNDLQKDLVRNFGRPHDDLDDEPPCIPYDLEKKLVRDFGGESHPEDLVENRDMEKELVRNFGQNDGFVLPEDMPFAHQALQKNLLRAYDGEDKQLNPHRRNEPKEVRRRGDDELTEENNLDDIPLDHMDLDEKQFQFNLGGTSYGQKKSMPDNDYSEMPNLRQSKNKGKRDSKKDKKGGYLEPADNTEEEMAFSGLSSDSPQAEGLVKNKTDKHRRQVGTNKVLVSKGSMREPTQNYKRPLKQTSKGEEESMEALFFNPVKEQFVEDVDTNARIKQVNEPAKIDKLRATDGFGDFEQIVEPRKSAKVLPKKPVHLPKPSKNILFGEEGFDEFAEVPARDEPSKRKKTENKYYKGSDDEGQQVIPRDKTNKYRRGARESQEVKKNDKKKFAEDEPIQQIKKQGQYEHLFEGQSNESIVVGEVRAPKKEETYEDVVNRNKQQVFKQDPSKRKLINLDSGQFEQVEYEDKPKGERYNEKNQDSGLFTSSRDQLGDSKMIRKRRSSSHLKFNKKSGALGSKEEIELEDESGVSRDSRRSKIIQKKVKSGALNIDDKSGGEEELDEIKF